MGFYYPEGYFGPVCDSLVSDDDIALSSERAIKDLGDPVVDTLTWPFPYGDPVGFPTLPPWLTGQICKQRTLDDGTIEYYDCVWTFDGVPTGDGDGNYDVDFFPPTFGDPDFGLTDKFFVPTATPDMCSPFDPDTNIRPITFYNNDGTQTIKYKNERSTPVTYNVTSETNEITESSGTLTAGFNSSGTALVVSGTGTGNLLLKLQWNDNPGTAGVAVDTIAIGTTTWTRGDGSGGGAQSGEQVEGFQVTPGTYNITYTGLNSANSPIQVTAVDQNLCLKDGHGQDCNANFSIHSLTSQVAVTNPGYWTEEANKYGVWTNPMLCTLPGEQQTVTYLINICESGTYGFTFGTDTTGSIYLNDSNSPALTATGGMLQSTSNISTTKSLTAGTLKLVVSVTNSDAGFQDSNGLPTGLAYSWQRNPGGWYIKMCKGAVCPSSNTSTWVRSGPHPAWSDFMDENAVYPSNQDTMSGVNHTNTWTVDLPNTGTYILETQADNWGSFSWDGTSLGSIGDNSGPPWGTAAVTSTYYTISNATVGPHTLSATVLNGTGNTNWSTNPGGVAFVLRNQLGSVIIRSTDLTNSGEGSLMWHTRMATGYIFSINSGLTQVVTGKECSGDSACVVTEGFSDAGYATTKMGYLKMNDGTILGVGPYVTGYVTSWLTQNAKTGVTYSQLFSQLATSYSNILSRKPDASGFDYWIHSFINLNPSWTLSDLNTAISADANGLNVGAYHELAMHTTHNGVEGNYDECGTAIYP